VHHCRVPRHRPTRIRTRRRLAWLPAGLKPLWPYAKRIHTTATGAAAPVTKLYSRVRRDRMPARTAKTMDEVTALGEGRMAIARTEQRLERSVPDGLPNAHPAFVAEAEQVVPRVVVAELPGGRVTGPYRAVITAGDTLVGELSPYFGTESPNQNPVFVDVRMPAPTAVPGSVGVLAARGDVSYYHFLTDVLPRLAILEEQGATPEHLYLPASLGFQQQLIELLGIPAERVIDADRVRHLKAELLVVPGLPDSDLKTPPWIVDFLRSRLRPPELKRTAGLRLYITRGARKGNRVVTNEREVLDALGDLGFTVIDPGAMPVLEQIGAFAEADWIVAPHGAALTNLAFASDGASVVELFAPDYVQGCYWKLSACVPGLTYSYLVGEGRTPRNGRMGGVDSDITVNVDELLSLLADNPASRGARDDQVVSGEDVHRA
jgi:capsular polysaccharide biosynthesis protein